MLEILLKYSSVYFISMFKFVLGPAAGTAAQLSVFETAALTVLGMMTTVVIIMLLGGRPLAWLSSKLRLDKKLENKNQRTKKMWEQFGIKGIAFLTPIFFT